MHYIEEKLSGLKDEFLELADGFERYSYLVEIAGLLPPYPEEKKDEEHLVKGCQSHVWVNTYCRDNKFFFDADSDTRIIKGIMLILQDVLCGAPMEEVSRFEFDILNEIGIKTEFSDTRQKGIASALEIIRDEARKMSS